MGKGKGVLGVKLEYVVEYNIHFQTGWLLFTIYFFLGEHPKPLNFLYPMYIFSIFLTFVVRIFSMTSLTGDIRERKDPRWSMLVQSTLFEICLEVIGISLFGL